MRISENATKEWYLPTGVIDLFKNNYQENPEILFQYFGSIHGYLYQYPGAATDRESCGKYDPRVQ